MKLIRILLTGLAAVLVAGTVASAAPSLGGLFDLEAATGATGASGSEGVTGTGPTGASAGEATGTSGLTGVSGPSGTTGASGASGVVGAEASTADFSECREQGLTGLENAICRHEALLVVHPNHAGLLNALSHLLANQAKKEAKHGVESGTEGEATTTTGSADAGSCPGRSCEPHGKGNGKGHSK